MITDIESALYTIERSWTVPTEPIWLLSVNQYHQMICSGILTDDDPVELLEGWLIVKMPKNPQHSLSTQLVREALDHLLLTGWYVDTHEPVTLKESEPEPDVVIVRGDTRQYLDRHPGPREVALVVEVADVSLQRDRILKKRLYASACSPVYWIVNLPERRFEVYADPSGPVEEPDYGQHRDYDLSDEIPLIIDGSEAGRLAVRELLP